MGKRRRKGRQFWAEADRQCPGTLFEPAAECKVQGKMGILEGRMGGQTHLAVFLFWLVPRGINLLPVAAFVGLGALDNTKNHQELARW